MSKINLRIYLLLIFCFFATSLFAQTGYYATDSTMSSGIKLIDGTDYDNSRVCKVKKGKEIIKFTPYEISEYGFNEDRTYVSKDIYISDSSEKVFLERLVKGETNLYYYKGKNIKTFFLEKDSTIFIEISKKNNNGYKSILNEFTNDCNAVSNAIKLVRYNKKSLAKLTERYNNCELKPFPFLRYGVIIGYEIDKLIPNSNVEIDYLNEFSYKYESGYTIGLFIDNPILVSDFSFHAEINYSKQSFSYNIKEENKDIDLLINISSLSIPLILRYTYPSLKFRPYINLGGIFSYHFNNKINSLFEANIDDNIIEINKISNSTIYDHQAGFNLGGGIQYSLDYRRSIFIELRYNKLYGISNSGSFNNDVLQILTGINF